MGGAYTLLDLLWALPVDARAAVFGASFSLKLAGCRRTCRELQQLHDSTITFVRLRPPAQHQNLASPLAKFARCTQLEVNAQLRLLTRQSRPRQSPRGSGMGADVEPSGAVDPLSAVLAGVTPAARERITHLTVSGKVSDRLSVARAVVAQLPLLTVLELVCGEVGSCDSAGYSGFGYRDYRSRQAADHAPQGGICGILGARLPALQQLTLSHVLTGADLTGLATLASGCPHLRELTLTFPAPPSPSGGNAAASGPTTTSGAASNPMRAALEGLAQLQRLERLTLALGLSARCNSGAGPLLTSLLASHRPPQLRTLALLPCHGHWRRTLDVGFEPGMIGAQGAEAEASWGMSRVEVDINQAEAVGLSLLVSALLAAADSPHQQSIPQLLLSSRDGSWELARNDLQPEAALPRLLARCAHVEVDRLPCVYNPGDWHNAGGNTAELLLAARLLGLPRELQLRHGIWMCRDAVCGTGITTAAVAAAAAAAPAAAGTPAGQPENVERQQQLGLGGGTAYGCRGCIRGAAGGGGGDGGSRPFLHLDTASPEEVLREALDRLWAEAAVHANSAAQAIEQRGGANGHADCPRGCNKSAASSSSSPSGGGRAEACGSGGQVMPGLLLLQGMPPPAPGHSGYPAAPDATAWYDWLEGVLASCFTAAEVPQPLMAAAQARIMGCQGEPSLPGDIRECFREGCHVAVPAAGVLLLKCMRYADAKALATRVAAAAAAAGGAGGLSAVASVLPDFGALTTVEGALSWRVFQVRHAHIPPHLPKKEPGC